MANKRAEAVDELFNRSKALASSPEWKVAGQLQELQFTFALHAANYLPLKTWSEEIVGDTDEKIRFILELFDVRHPERVDGRVTEACRLLMNFLASAKMLVDHTRNHVRDLYVGHVFADEHEDQRKLRFATDPLARFVQQLRDYNLHRRIPAVQCRMEIEAPNDGGVPRTYVFLNTEGLEQWDKWSPPAKKFLAERRHLPLAIVAEEYMDIITDFYQWMWRREHEIWGEALEKVEREQQELGELDRIVFPERYADADSP